MSNGHILFCRLGDKGTLPRPGEAHYENCKFSGPNQYSKSSFLVYLRPLLRGLSLSKFALFRATEEIHEDFQSNVYLNLFQKDVLWMCVSILRLLDIIILRRVAEAGIHRRTRMPTLEQPRVMTKPYYALLSCDMRHSLRAASSSPLVV